MSHERPIGPSRKFSDLTGKGTGELRAMAASGLLTAPEQWGAEDELGLRDVPVGTAREIASALCPAAVGLGGCTCQQE